jgi:hypothetical protein
MWVVRLEGGRFHSAHENFEDADEKADYLTYMGTNASFEFEANIIKETLESSIAKEKLESCIVKETLESYEREQFAKKMLAIMKTRAFKDFYSGNWHFLNDEEVIKVIQKLF